jgi:hypothetical protein
LTSSHNTVPQQSIRFRIRPDGRVEELVEGVKGASCQELTRSIEARLGSVQTSSATSDHYVSAGEELTVQQNSHVALQHG